MNYAWKAIQEMKPSEGSSRPLSRRTLLTTAIAIFIACGVIFSLFFFTEVGNRLALNVLAGLSVPILLVLAFFSLYSVSQRLRLRTVYVALALLYAAGFVYFFAFKEMGRQLLLSALSSLMVLVVMFIASSAVDRYLPAIRDWVEKAGKQARVLLLLLDGIARVLGDLFKGAGRRIQIAIVAVLLLAFLIPIVATLVWPVPRLIVDSENASFGRFENSLSLRLSSSSERRYIEWEMVIPEGASAWLSADKRSGTATEQGETVKLFAARHSLKCAPQQTTQLTIRYLGWRTETVAVTIDNMPDPEISEEPIVFRADESLKLLEIANAGANNLCFSYDGINEHAGGNEDEEALKRCCIAVSLRDLPCGPRSAGVCEITLNRQHLPRRLEPYVGEFSFYVGCCGGELKLDRRLIKVYHPPPQISIQPNPLVVDPKLMEGNQVTVTLENTGDVTAAWRFSENGVDGGAEWISEISSGLGNLDVKESVVVRITVDPCSLPSEPETQELRILLSDEGGEMPLICDLRPARPVIDVRPTQLDIGSEKSGSLTVNNVGCGSLHWQATWEDVNPADDKDPKDGIPDWIECLEPPSGRCVEGDDPDMVVVRVNRAAMSPRQRTATLRLSQEGMESDFQTVDISIEVEPELAISLSKLPFGYSKQSLSFMVKNVGSGTLFWEIKPPDTPWLHIDPTQGSCYEGNSTRIEVTIDRSQLVEKKDSATLLVVPTEGGEQQAVEISVRDFRRWNFDVCPQVWGTPIDGAWQAGYGISFSGQWPDSDVGLTYLGIETEDESRTELYGSRGFPIATWHFCTLRLAGGVGGATRREGWGEQERKVYSLLLVGLAEYEMRLWDVPEGQLSLGVSASVHFLLRESQWRFGVGLSLHVEKKR